MITKYLNSIKHHYPIFGLFSYPKFKFSEDLSNTFKSRSRLNEFFKYTHPDVLSNAPDKIKEENLKSIKILNSYLDALGQNKGVPEENLKFYITEKETTKKSKYIYFDIKLPPLKPEAKPDILNIHLDNVIKNLLKNLKEAKDTADPFKKANKKEKVSNLEEEIDDEEDTAELDDIMRSSKKGNLEEQYFQKMIEKLELSSMVKYKTLMPIKKRLEEKVEEMLYLQNDNYKPSKIWVKMMLKDSTSMLQNISEYSLEPSIIFFDEKLTEDNVKKFLQLISLKKEGRKYQEFNNVKKISDILASSRPPINLLISDKYDINDIPGFITIPYNFTNKKLIKFIEENFEKSKESRLQFDENLKKIEELKNILKTKINFQKIEVSKELLKNNTSVENAILYLKKLLNLSLKSNFQILNQEKFKFYILNIGAEAASVMMNNINLPAKFDENQVYDLLKKI